MFNIGGGEILLILLLALIVLGPDKLPEFARKVGKVSSELRRMSQGFQNEMRQAMDLDDTPKTSSGPRLVAPPPAAGQPDTGVIDTTARDADSPTEPDDKGGASGSSAA
jgi:Tat protein translocase TatB subunit